MLLSTHVTHLLTIVHERLHGPQLGAHDKAADVAGDVGMQEQLGQLHLVLHFLQLRDGEQLEVDGP